MPNMFGGDQLDPEYAPWANIELNDSEREVIEKIEEKQDIVQGLDKNISELEAKKSKLLTEIEVLQSQCRHHNIANRRGMYENQYSVCVDCGKENV